MSCKRRKKIRRMCTSARVTLRHRTGPTCNRALLDLDEMSSSIAEIEGDGKRVPVLLRQYLKIGGELLAFNVDKISAMSSMAWSWSTCARPIRKAGDVYGKRGSGPLPRVSRGLRGCQPLAIGSWLLAVGIWRESWDPSARTLRSKDPRIPSRNFPRRVGSSYRTTKAKNPSHTTSPYSEARRCRTAILTEDQRDYGHIHGVAHVPIESGDDQMLRRGDRRRRPPSSWTAKRAKESSSTGSPAAMIRQPTTRSGKKPNRGKARRQRVKVQGNIGGESPRSDHQKDRRAEQSQSTLHGKKCEPQF